MIHPGPGKASHIPLKAVRVSGFSMVQSLEFRVLSRESCSSDEKAELPITKRQHPFHGILWYVITYFVYYGILSLIMVYSG